MKVNKIKIRIILIKKSNKVIVILMNNQMMIKLFSQKMMMILYSIYKINKYQNIVLKNKNK